MDEDWQNYVTQVRDMYYNHQINLAQFENDLKVAILLDEGILPPKKAIPDYLRDRFGLPAATMAPIDVT